MKPSEMTAVELLEYSACCVPEHEYATELRSRAARLQGALVRLRGMLADGSITVVHEWLLSELNAFNAPSALRGQGEPRAPGKEPKDSPPPSDPHS